MFNYSNAKKLVSAGFAINLLVVILNSVLTFLGYTIFGYSISGNIGGFYANIFNLTGLISILSLFITAGGYLIMWLCEKSFFDFASTAILAADLLCDLFLIRLLGVSSMLSSYISIILSAALYLLLALRIKNDNPMLRLLLGCAFLFRIVMLLYYILPIGFLPYAIVSLIIGAGNIVCAGLCFIASRQE